MFNKRKKAEELQKIKELRTLKEERIRTGLSDAKQIKDPAERVLYLQELKEIAAAEIRREQDAIKDKTHTSTGRGVLGGTGLAAAGGAIVAVVTTAGIGAIVAVPLFVAGLGAASKRADTVEKKAKTEARDYMREMTLRRGYIELLMQRAVESNVAEIANSPLKEKVLALPGLASSFANAAQWHIIVADRNAQAAEEKKTAAPAKQKQSPAYKDLKGL
jgi:hypothetical protein